MQNDDTITRRGLFMKLGILFNGLVAVVLAVPLVRFLLSAVAREHQDEYLSWVTLGPVGQFPEGETRLATLENGVLSIQAGELPTPGGPRAANHDNRERKRSCV